MNPHDRGQLEPNQIDQPLIADRYPHLAGAGRTQRWRTAAANLTPVYPTLEGGRRPLAGGTESASQSSWWMPVCIGDAAITPPAYAARDCACASQTWVRERSAGDRAHDRRTDAPGIPGGHDTVKDCCEP